MTISVFLLDDHELVRTGLKTVFESEDDIQVVGEAATVAEALVRIPQVRPDVAILDVRLPDGQGVEVCREIRSTVEPPPACLMLTSYSDDDALFGAIMAGAAGYMLKQVSGRSLVDAVRTVAVGGSLLDATLTASVMNKLRGETASSAPDPRYEQLSPQERRVLDLVAEGLTNRQIAERLFLAEKTVKNYVSSVAAQARGRAAHLGGGVRVPAARRYRPFGVILPPLGRNGWGVRRIWTPMEYTCRVIAGGRRGPCCAVEGTAWRGCRAGTMSRSRSERSRKRCAGKAPAGSARTASSWRSTWRPREASTAATS